MTVSDRGTVDFIGTEPSTGTLVLGISDHLPWEPSHLSLLEQKLQSYLGYIQSGQASQDMPGSSKFKIQLLSKFRPTTEAENWLLAAGAELKKHGVTFTFGPNPRDGYFGEST